ncbi:hypothetical protein QR680_001241 [Steinernema hermaphroditum]|uniref:Cyclopropane-fatty-acyl-phospholipid synthase n=1 Tax=Steinernema hermaphroditum TaxID=289476 RepID=A0AA39LFL3_9BILA|nr:hypothetical protein QR680_001241 [Steinernema hermaphroditum]
MTNKNFVTFREADVELFIHNPIKFCIRMLMDPKLGLGESFMAGEWDARPLPKDLLTLLIRARNESAKASKGKRGFKMTAVLLGKHTQLVRGVAWFFNYLQHKIRENTLLGSQKNIREHYDLGNDMFELFLDRSMTYSCGVFEDVSNVALENEKLLYEAQMRKYDRIIELLQIKPTDHVLEIGCGWGGLSLRAVKKFGCKWTGLTLSREQLAYAQDLVEKENLSDKITLKYCDYRLESNIYDKVVAVEMIEAVGHEYLPLFFQTINDRLKRNGIACIQGITCPDSYYDKYRRSNDFIKKHIFPGGHMPSLSAIAESLPASLEEVSCESIGPSYAVTLDFWDRAWLEREHEIRKLGYSKRFHRKWQFYFELCSALFEYRHIDDVQMSFKRF